MSREQSDRMDAMFRAKLSGTVAEGWWKDEMLWDDPEAEDSEAEEDDKTVVEHEEDQSSGYSSDDSTPELC